VQVEIAVYCRNNNNYWVPCSLLCLLAHIVWPLLCVRITISKEIMPYFNPIDKYVRLKYRSCQKAPTHIEQVSFTTKYHKTAKRWRQISLKADGSDWVEDCVLVWR